MVSDVVESSLCRMTKLGTAYKGKTVVTKSGWSCQHWKKQEPHTHIYMENDYFFSGTIAEQKNYCRNPYGSPGGSAASRQEPWCFVKSSSPYAPEWEYCNVDYCELGNCYLILWVSKNCLSDALKRHCPPHDHKKGKFPLDLCTISLIRYNMYR